MAKRLQLRRGTTAEHTTTGGGFTGAVGEVTVDTTKDTVVVHDGSTAGGSPLATEAILSSKPHIIPDVLYAAVSVMRYHYTHLTFTDSSSTLHTITAVA